MLDLELLALFVLAALICNAAAGLAGGLAGSLALAAAAVLRAFAQIAGVQSLNVFHGKAPFDLQISMYSITGISGSQIPIFLAFLFVFGYTVHIITS